MREAAEELLPIDLQLRFALFGLECAFCIPLAALECERVFHDAAENQVSAKQYSFFESPKLVVTGRVDEYESETIWLQVRGYRGVGEVLRRVTEGAKYQMLRLRRNPDERSA